MTKRLIEIEDDLLEMAKKVAGEKTIRGTVEKALKELVARDQAARHVARLRRGLLDPRRVAEARKPKIEVLRELDDG